MPIILVDSFDTTLQTLTGGTDLFVTAAGTIGRQNETVAVDGTGEDMMLVIDGRVAARGVALQLDGTGFTHVDIGATANVRSGIDSGIILAGQGLVENAGTVWGGAYALNLRPDVGSVIRVENAGTLASNFAAVSQTVVGFHGRIEIDNTGLIWGDTFAISLSSSIFEGISVRNRGEMIGNVQLADSADVFDGRGGILRGTVTMAGGNDRVIPGLAAETFSGGAGRDTLDFASGGAVRLSLAGTFTATGSAAGDNYAGFEVVIGSRSGDRIEGRAAGETLRGQGGADTLAGAGGADRIEGGAGVDRVTGGAGNDVYVFASLADRGDIIADFGRVSGNDDRFEMKAAALAGGLAPGGLPGFAFTARPDNVAQDSDDRFIFRTTDRTLWFDANGSAAGGLTLLADLQAGAVLTAADILLV